MKKSWLKIWLTSDVYATRVNKTTGAGAEPGVINFTKTGPGLSFFKIPGLGLGPVPGWENSKYQGCGRARFDLISTEPGPGLDQIHRKYLEFRLAKFKLRIGVIIPRQLEQIKYRYETNIHLQALKQTKMQRICHNYFSSQNVPSFSESAHILQLLTSSSSCETSKCSLKSPSWPIVLCISHNRCLN